MMQASAPGAGEMSAAMREREKERAQEEDDLRKTGLGGKQDLDRGRRASTMSKGLGSLRAFADFMSGKEDPTKSDEAVHL